MEYATAPQRVALSNIWMRRRGRTTSATTCLTFISEGFYYAFSAAGQRDPFGLVCVAIERAELAFSLRAVCFAELLVEMPIWSTHTDTQ